MKLNVKNINGSGIVCIECDEIKNIEINICKREREIRTLSNLCKNGSMVLNFEDLCNRSMYWCYTIEPWWMQRSVLKQNVIVSNACACGQIGPFFWSEYVQIAIFGAFYAEKKRLPWFILICDLTFHCRHLPIHCKPILHILLQGKFTCVLFRLQLSSQFTRCATSKV